MKFATRSGTNQFTGSAYEYHRDRGLNTNYYFNEVNNLDKNILTLNQWGFREGGPIVIPKMYDGRGKAFFFFNFEQLRFPLSNTRNRGILSPAAQAGHLPVLGRRQACRASICTASRPRRARRRRPIRRLPRSSQKSGRAPSPPA